MRLVEDERVFDKKYGEGSHRRLLEELDNPHFTYAQIASEFHVFESTVQLWHDILDPGGIRGFERRRLRAQQGRQVKQKEMFLGDFVARMFYRFTEINYPDAQIELIPVSGEESANVRRREVKLNGKLVLLRKASRRRFQDGENRHESYELWTPRKIAEAVFYLLRHQNFLFIPHSILPYNGTTYTDTERSPYFRYRNNFDALKTQRDGYNGNRPQSSRT